MKKTLLLGLILSASLMANETGAAVYKKCTGCHGSNGEKQALGKSVILKGQEADILISKIKGYKEGKLNINGFGGLMKGQVSSMKEDEIKAVAEYISLFE